MSRKWTIGLADGGHNYVVTAQWMEDDETYNVVLKVDGKFMKALPSDDPTVLALTLIADAELEAEGDLNVQNFSREIGRLAEREGEDPG